MPVVRPGRAVAALVLILLLALGFLVLFHVFVLLYEEPALRTRFGESYARYTRAVRRWLPRLPDQAPG